MITRWCNDIEYWYSTTVKYCNCQKERELAVGVIVAFQSRSVHNSKSTVPYRVEKIEYVGDNVSFVEMSKYSPIDEILDWVRVNTKENRIVPYMDGNAIPYSVLAATTRIKAKLAADNSCSDHSIYSVISFTLLPALGKLTDSAEELLCSIRELFAINGMTMPSLDEQDAAENKSYDGDGSREERETYNNAELSTRVSIFTSRFRTFLLALSQFAIVLACCVDVTSACVLAEAATDVERNCIHSDPSLVLQDVEHDATPLKQRIDDSVKSPSCADYHTSGGYKAEPASTMEEVIEQLCTTLGRFVIPLVAAHPQPLLVSIATWSLNMCAVDSVIQSLQVLGDVLHHKSNTCVSISVEHLNRLDERTIQLLSARTAQFDCTGSAILSFSEMSMADNIVRQDWGSHSKYMRDKKFTHGIVALCTTMRSSIWDMYRTSTKSTVARLKYHGEIGAFSTLSLRLLLNTTLLVCQTYMGVTELSATDCTELSLSAAEGTVRMVQPSRVRTAQWRKDLCYMVYMVLDTLAWIITQDTVLAVSYTNAAADKIEDSTVPLLEELYKCASVQKQYDATGRSVTISAAEREALITSATYSDQAGVISELLKVLRYLLLGLYIATEPDAQRVLEKLTQTIERAPSRDADIQYARENISGGGSSGGGVWQSLLEVAGSLSVFDTLTDLFITGFTTSEGTPSIHQGSAHVEATATPVSVSVAQLPSAAFSTTVEVVAHCGMHAFHINEHSVALYAQEHQQLAAAVAKDGGCVNRLSIEKVVMHQRISSVTMTRPHSLLRLLTASEDQAFVSIFKEVNSVLDENNIAVDTRSLQKVFVVEMLRRRYEMNPAVYPALTEAEGTAAVKIQLFIDELVKMDG